jgi:cytochrome c peroxidase
MTVRGAGVCAVALFCLAGCRNSTPDAHAQPAPASSTARSSASAPFAWKLPPGLPVPIVPADNPMTDAKIALGRRLFYDTRLSGNGSFACATCHQQRRAFTDGLAHALGSMGQEHPRSAMSLANVAYNVSFGWADPGLRTLEAQMAVPMFNQHPIELGLKGNERAAVERFKSSDEDRRQFQSAFPGDADPITLSNIVRAIAAFERTLVSGDSPLDRYLYRDDRAALSPSARRGMTLFFSDRLRCSECHSNFNLSGPVTFAGAKPVQPSFHNTALYDVDGRGGYPVIDRGLLDKTKRPEDMGRFRAPTLRNIAVTAPYMHDGSLLTLEDTVAHYASGGKPSPFRSLPIRGFPLTETETVDLVAFLESLTDETFLTNPAFADPAPPRSYAPGRPAQPGALPAK